MKTWQTTHSGTLRSTGAALSLVSLGVALLGGFLSSFFLAAALVFFLVGLVTYSIGYLADRRADHRTAKPA
jgi:hypothetical protein